MKLFTISEERREMIDYMAPERMATDGQWKALKYLGGAAGAIILGVVGYQVAQEVIAADPDTCRIVVDTNGNSHCE